MFKLLLKILHKLYFIFLWNGRKEFQGYIELKDQDANDYILEVLQSGSPCMISKFGSIELNALVQYKMNQQKLYSLKNVVDYVTMQIPCLWWNEGIEKLCTNAGFFPNDCKLQKYFFDEYMASMKEIDILGSYIYSEKFFNNELSQAKRVNLNGYYAPFFWNDPWTKILKGKKVLVIHPFSEDIKKQYAKKNLLWKNPYVLPDFQLITYKAVQSMLGEETEFPTWFDALDKMKEDISVIDFDIALIGCGAYGMPLAAHVKKMGKQAIHLAGWTQVLFGIIGKRWENDPIVSRYINETWVHPSLDNVPKNAQNVENGCYW